MVTLDPTLVIASISLVIAIISLAVSIYSAITTNAFRRYELRPILELDSVVRNIIGSQAECAVTMINKGKSPVGITDVQTYYGQVGARVRVQSSSGEYIAVGDRKTYDVTVSVDELRAYNRVLNLKGGEVLMHITHLMLNESDTSSWTIRLVAFDGQTITEVS